MPLITGVKNVKNVYKNAAQKGWVIPCFCAENLTTIEAVLGAAQEKAVEKGNNVPVTIAITCQYDHRGQAANYTHSRNWDTGLKLFYKDCDILARKSGDYDNVDVMIHLDHIQHDTDKELLARDLSIFSSIMYDASTVDFEKNIKLTADFVEKQKDNIVIEGACDEIVDATGIIKNEITMLERAAVYVKKTGVDMIVANLGTEHRATAKNLIYQSRAARDIKEAVGNIIVLHGTSSVSNDQIEKLFQDGICKVNIWTTLERDSTPVLFESMVKNAARIAGKERAKKLLDKSFIGPECDLDSDQDIKYFTTVYRQDIIYAEMKRLVKAYFDMWYK